MESGPWSAGFERSFVTASDGIELAVYRAGPPGPAAFRLHGFTLDHTTMLGVAGPLAEAGFEVLVPDLRGHGSSSLGAAEPSLARLVRDGLDVVAERGRREVTVIGHSLGALIALGIRPERAATPHVCGVVAVAAMPASPRSPLRRLGARVFTSAVGARLLAREKIGRSIIRTWYRRDAIDLEIEQARRLSVRCPVATRVAIGRAMRHVDLRPTFARPGPPTLVLCGTEDRATPIECSRRIADAIPNAELMLVDRSGHMVVTERPNDIAHTIMDWMERSGLGPS